MFNTFDAQDNCGTSDANFRAFGSQMSNYLGMFLRRTADTGQINWTTVLKPSAVWTVVGYEIYAFKDPLQSQQPLFIKIGYGSGAVFTNQQMQLQITLGTGTDGAGNLTGQFFGPCALGYNSAAQTALCTNFICGGDDYLTIIINAPGTSNPAYQPTRRSCFSIERSKNGIGESTTEGYYIISATASYVSATDTTANNFCCFSIPGKSILKQYVAGFIFGQQTNQSGVDGTIVNGCPVRFFSTKESGVSKSLIGYRGSDFPMDAIVGMLCYDGITRIYRTFNINYATTSERGFGESSKGCIMYRVD